MTEHDPTTPTPTDASDDGITFAAATARIAAEAFEADGRRVRMTIPVRTLRDYQSGTRRGEQDRSVDVPRVGRPSEGAEGVVCLWDGWIARDQIRVV